MRKIVMTFVLFGALRALASAQEVRPPIGPFIVDIRATFPMFPSDDGALAESRGLTIGQLPGQGFGGAIGAHVYLFTWHEVAFGIGGEFMTARSRQLIPAVPGQASLPSVTTHFTSRAPQVSLNFGSGDGWSYLSVGVGQATWSVVPDGSAPTPADNEQRTTINYGGGARWFPKKHLSVGFDIRQYAISQGLPQPQLGFPPTPHTTLTVIAAGVSLR